MAMTIEISVDPGANTDLTIFDLYSDADGYTVPFAVGVPITDLWPAPGRIFYNVPDGTVDVKVVATGICSNEGTVAISTTTTTTLYEGPILNTTEITNIITTQATSGGDIDYAGTGPITMTSQGLEWDTDPLFSAPVSFTNSLPIVDPWVTNLTGLTDGLQYYCRAWAVITTVDPSPPPGDKYYGDVETLVGFVPPTLLTSVDNILEFEATGVGEVTDVGSGEGIITVRGIVLSQTTNPFIGGPGVDNFIGLIDSNPWNVLLTLPVSEITYYIKSWANVDGIIYYGPEVVFDSIKPLPPTVLTYPTDNILSESALGHGEVTAEDALNPVIERGICWGVWPLPNIFTSESIAIVLAGLGLIDETMSPLIPGATYYVRAYAKTADSYYYGNQEIFETLGSPGFVEFNASFGNTQIVACNTPNNTTIWIPAEFSWTSTFVIWGADDGTIVPPSGFYNVGGQVREWDSLALLLSPVIPCTASTLIKLNFGNTLEIGCFTPERILSLYIDSTSFETATGIWDDLAYTIPSPPGFYSFEGYVREWNGVDLLAYVPCISSYVTLGYDLLAGQDACGGTIQEAYIDNSFELSTGLWVDETLTIPMPSGFYSDQTIWRQWDGVSAFIEVGLNFCS